jgi:flagellar biosynthesis/type III secretory pathway M-ring protein FliF/YscJ
MQKNKKKIILASALAVVLILGYFIFWFSRGGKELNQANDAVVYYYGQECSHCQVVAKFLEDNKMAEKVPFEKKEVFHSVTNSREMAARVSQCGIAKSQAGVPLLYAHGQCYLGQDEVINFFKKEAGI